jgi:hypothetical protein
MNLTQKLTWTPVLKKRDAFLEDWIQLGAEKDVSFTTYVSVISELAT